MMKKLSVLLLTCLLPFLIIGTASAFDFTGHIKYLNGTGINQTNASITVYSFASGPPQVVNVSSAMSNSAGEYNVTDISGNNTTNYLYKLQLIKYSSDGVNASLIGPSLPQLPYGEFAQQLSDPTTYLKNATTLYIPYVLAINRSGSEVQAPFQYQIKDQSFGFPIEENFDTYVSSANIIVPTNRNYSVMFYPNESQPVSVEITAADIEGNFTGGKYYIELPINASTNLRHVSGYVKTDSGAIDFNNLDVIPYLLESGNMVFEEGMLPLNMSDNDGGTDIFNITTGFYNMTLPGTEATSNILLVAYANKSTYYAGFENISLGYSGGEISQFNITVKPLAGSYSNFTAGSAPNTREIVTYKARINILNSSSDLMTGTSSHIEAELIYGDLTFTWMVDTGQTGYIELPLWNDTGINKLSVFSQQGAPRELDYTAAEVRASPINITQTNLEMKTPDDADLSGLSIYMYMSNSTCDVPNPPSSCVISSSTDSNFNPLNAVISGAPISFRMIYNNIGVHYTDVDLLASGPPDAVFDSSANTTGTNGTSGSFANMWRFGSMGPDIYDEVLISASYSDNTHGGLNETQPVSLHIPYFYDDDWNIVWTFGLNTTAQLPSDYTDFNSATYGTLVNGTNVTCNSSDTDLSSGLCYINTTANTIWVKIPHFSGVGTDLDGTGICVEDWTCSDWSDCDDGTRTRTCTDSHSCGTEVDMPDTIDTCAEDEDSSGSGEMSTEDDSLTVISYTWASVDAEDKKTYLIANNNIKLTSIEFTLEEAATDVTLRVEALATKPDSVSKPSGSAYKYMRISSTNMADNIDSAEINFKVPKTWIQTNNIGLSTIKLLRYDDGWDKLSTTRTDSDSSYYHFKADTPGFSYFAITGVATTTSVSSTTESSTSGATTASESETTEEDTQQAKTVSFSLGEAWMNYTAYVALMAGVVVVLLYYLNLEGKLNKLKKKLFSKRRSLRTHKTTTRKALFSLSRRPRISNNISRRVRTSDVGRDFKRFTRNIKRRLDAPFTTRAKRRRPRKRESMRKYGYRVKRKRR